MARLPSGELSDTDVVAAARGDDAEITLPTGASETGASNAADTNETRAESRRRFIARRRSRGAWVAIGLSIAGPLLAVATYATLSGADEGTRGALWFKALILLDVCYLVVLASLIGLQVARLLMARRARSAGSRLHGRMVAFFTGVAAAPAILVAIFFFLVIQLGFEAWFSNQVSSVVQNSREVAQAYAREHRQSIGTSARAFAADLNLAARRFLGGLQDRRFRAYLDRTTEKYGFSDVYLIDSDGAIIVKGSDSFEFTYTPPSSDDLTRALIEAPLTFSDATDEDPRTRETSVVIREDEAAGEMRALVRLDALFDAFLYVSRPVDGAVLASLDLTNRGVESYNRLQKNRDAWLAQFALLYLGFVVLVLMAAIYLGLWFAERLARPIGRLAAAAQRIRSGDLVVRVKEDQSDDEIGLLSRVFNRMTEEVKRKQDALTDAKEESERRRLFSEAVLSGVSAGVLGLDADGRIRLMNRSAAKLLDLSTERDVGRSFAEAAPEFADMFADAAVDPTIDIERPIRISRNDESRELLARITSEVLEAPDGGVGAGSTETTPVGAEIVGYVVTVDDLTALVAAQKTAAWADVARRIAHEIKNPLTPIQLAAERLRRKYSDRLGDDSEAFERYTETIVRQTGDIGRMVDAFVRFAKMPAAVLEDWELAALTREAVLLQEEARAHIAYVVSIEDEPLSIRCDRGQILQALTNLLQNAADAIQARVAADAAEGRTGAAPEIRVVVRRVAGQATVAVSDNGVGLPQKDRRKLLEPYVTTREKGAGLGLAIVLKIVEEHGGDFALADAEPFAEGAAVGASATMGLPLRTAETPSPGSRTPADDERKERAEAIEPA